MGETPVTPYLLRASFQRLPDIHSGISSCTDSWTWVVLRGGALSPRTMKSGRLACQRSRNCHLLLLALPARCLFLQDKQGSAPGFRLGVQYLATKTLCTGPGEVGHPVDVPAPRRPPLECGGDTPVLTTCLPPSALASASVDCSGSPSSVNTARPRLLPSLSVPEGTAFGRHLYKGVVSACLESTWQRGIDLGVSQK